MCLSNNFAEADLVFICRRLYQASLLEDFIFIPDIGVVVYESVHLQHKKVNVYAEANDDTIGIIPYGMILITRKVCHAVIYSVTVIISKK